jgi:surface antigen
MSSSFYIGARRPRHSAFAAIALGLFAAVTLSGCGAMTVPIVQAAANGRFNAAPANRPLLAAAKVSDGVMPGDWEAVRRAIASVPASEARSALAWADDETGNTGALAIAAASEKNGALCRGFSTTVNDLHGIRQYRGEACRRGGDAGWQLSGVSPDDSALL